MDGFLDPEEEYDLLHQDELEVLREMEQENATIGKPASTTNTDHGFSQNVITNSVARCTFRNENNATVKSLNEIGNDGKRQLSVEPLSDSDSELAPSEPPFKKHRDDAFGDENDFDLNMHRGVTCSSFPNWPFLTFNTEKSERFYVRFNEAEDENVTVSHPCKPIHFRVLSESYENLKLEAVKVLQESLARVTVDGNETGSSVMEENSDLWVEKYKPKSYVELLSDECVNRSLLNWLKKWDSIVFNKLHQGDSTRSISHEKNKKFPQMGNDGVGNGLDEEGRPQLKIALLCGPPGLGKTTLAHVIASLAGYNVVEVNASDDRTPEAFHTKLEAATQMQSVKGTNKPNCLILDEIDGAPATSIDYLLKYINGKTCAKGSGGKKEKTKSIIKRPIICICNEPYVPSLRQLRQQAYVVHFPNTSSSRLAQRLLEICKKQNIKTDLSTLTLLCDKMQSDIRGCISTLHFFKTKNGFALKQSDINKYKVGQKDLQKGLFKMWQEVFQFSSKKNIFNNLSLKKFGSDTGAKHFHFSSKNMERLRYLVQLFQSCGDYERLQQGIYENYLKMKFHQSMAAISDGTEWFSWFDIMDTNIKENQNYILLSYLPYAFSAWHFLFSSPNFTKISFPKAGYENHLKEVRNKQIVSDVLRGLNVSVRAHTYRRELILDILPMLKTILVPPLRPVNLKLFNEREKKEFHHLIDVMIDYNLNYIQERSQDGSYHYHLDPDIEEIILFGGSERNKVSFSYNMKQFICREVEMERVRRTEIYLSPNEKKNENENENEKQSRALTPKEVNSDHGDGLQYKDFFGRIVTKKIVDEDKRPLEKVDRGKSKIWFAYKDGVSNAVKKDVTLAYWM